MERVYVHQSDSHMFRTCRRLWKLGSPRQLDLTPVVPSTALWLGTGIHLALQYYYSRKDEVPNLVTLASDASQVFDTWALEGIQKVERNPLASLTTERREKLYDTRALGNAILHYYWPWARENDDFKVLLTESEFETPLYDKDGCICVIPVIQNGEAFLAEVWTKGRIDAAVELPDRNVWLLEHKTMAQMETTYFSLLDEQSGTYLDAIERTIHRPVVGVLYNILRKKAPTVPKTLVHGGLSKAMNIDTTYEVYLQAIRENGLDAKEYTDILTKLRDQGDKFYHREPVFRTKAERADLVMRTVQIAQDMFNNPTVYPTPDFFNCRRCQFLPVCLAMANGADWKWIVDTQFQKRGEFEVVPEPVGVLDE